MMASAKRLPTSPLLVRRLLKNARGDVSRALDDIDAAIAIHAPPNVGDSLVDAVKALRTIANTSSDTSGAAARGIARAALARLGVPMKENA